MTGADPMASFSTTDDALVLASVSSPAERALLSDWLQRQRRQHPESKVDVLELPEGDPPPGVLARLVEELEADEDRTVVPVRVFWVPGGLPTRSKVVALISGRDTYRPPEILQRRILKRDPSRARVVAGEPAKVSELRQQWNDTTVGENPRDLAHFVIRRAILAIERVELRLLGPEYKSPKLIKPEMLASARFREGLGEDSRRNSRSGRRDARRTGNRVEPVLRRPHPVIGQGDLQPGIRPQHRLRPGRDRIDAARVGNSPGGAAVLASVLPRRCDRSGGDAGEPTAAGAHVRWHQSVIRVHGAADAALRRHLHPAQARRPVVQVRAEAIRRLHRGEAVQPQLVDRGHPVTDRKDVAAQARSDELRRRRLPRGSQRRHPSAAGVDQLRPAARNRRIRRIRPRRREDARGAVLAVQLHQGAGRAQLRQDLRPFPGSRVDAGVSGRAGWTDRQG